jgi:hypothetical protein
MNTSKLNFIQNSVKGLKLIISTALKDIKKLEYIKNIKDEYVKARKSPIDFTTLMNFLCTKVGKNISYANATSQINISRALVAKQSKLDLIQKFTKSAFVQQKNKIESRLFEHINNSLLNNIYNNNKLLLQNPPNRRIVAVDGSQINFYNCDALELPLSNNGQYRKGILSAMFDVDTKIPINYMLNGDTNERDLLLSQVDCLKKGDILVIDRGYFSFELFCLLSGQDFDCVYRLQKKLKIIKDNFTNNNINDVIVDYTYNDMFITIRIIRYKINNKYFYIGTTIFDPSYKVKWFEDVYHKRWDIEEHFKSLKNDIGISPRSKSLNGIQQDLYINQFILIINSFIIYLLSRFMKDDSMLINRKNAIDITINNLLPYFFYGKIGIKKILFILMIIQVNVTKIVPNRSRPRILILPVSKWYNININR